jgi:hypothetical protein
VLGPRRWDPNNQERSAYFFRPPPVLLVPEVVLAMVNEPSLAQVVHWFTT